jgi:hypothetical protein
VGIPIAALQDPDRWLQQRPVSGVGGRMAYYVHPAVYNFRDLNGTDRSLQGEILIAPLRPDNQKVPSLLGWDVLQHFKLTVDWANRSITLE